MPSAQPAGALLKSAIARKTAAATTVTNNLANAVPKEMVVSIVEGGSPNNVVYKVVQNKSKNTLYVAITKAACQEWIDATDLTVLMSN